MVALEAVCKHFGKEVHPESEWIYMQKERSYNIFQVCASLYEERFSKLKLSVFSVTSMSLVINLLSGELLKGSFDGAGSGFLYAYAAL